LRRSPETFYSVSIAHANGSVMTPFWAYERSLLERCVFQARGSRVIGAIVQQLLRVVFAGNDVDKLK